uniref:hypothetical protein n=1 Tax=Marinobacterium profundum TaxID=1714300 RepID=UPI000829F583|nr:hypothetical protein [Marinobacterium profundum]
MKALLYTLTLLLFSLGAGASEHAHDEALPASHADFSTLSAAIDPAASSGADRVFVAVVLISLFDLPQALFAFKCQAACGSSTGALHAIRAPPAFSAFFPSV